MVRFVMRRRPDRERGAAMVEFALIVPLFLALVFGIISYGYMLSYRQGMSQAAAEGARAAAVTQVGSVKPALERARDAVNRSLDSYGVECTAGGQLIRDGKDVGDCSIPAAATCPGLTGTGAAQCYQVTLKHTYRDNPLIPSFPGLGVTLPDDLEYTSYVEVGS